MELYHMISDKIVNLNLNAESKKEVITSLVKLLKRDGRIRYKKGFLADVMDREASMSTNMGGGIAIPHAKSDFVDQSSIAFARLTKPIDWNGEGDVDLVFLLAINETKNNVSHLETIAKLATLLVDEDFKSKLYTIKNSKELVELMETYDGGDL